MLKMSGRLAQDGGMRAVAQEGLKSGPRTIPRIWVVRTDRSHVDIFRKLDGSFDLLGHGESEVPYEEEGINQSAGRHATPAGSGASHSMEPHEASVRHEELSFFHDLARFLKDAAYNDAFDRLVLASSPRTLGELRKCLDKSVHERVSAELDKDLMNLSEHELKGYIQDIMWF